MDWRTTYPTLAAVQVASLQTALTWDEHLPAPQTDVDRTVRRRLKLRINQLTGIEIRRQAPELADQFNTILDRMRDLGIPTPPGVERM